MRDQTMWLLFWFSQTHISGCGPLPSGPEYSSSVRAVQLVENAHRDTSYARTHWLNWKNKAFGRPVVSRGMEQSLWEHTYNLWPHFLCRHGRRGGLFFAVAVWQATQTCWSTTRMTMLRSPSAWLISTCVSRYASSSLLKRHVAHFWIYEYFLI